MGFEAETPSQNFLRRRRGHRNRANLPPLTVRMILKWARLHQARTGKWPDQHSGVVPNGLGDTWKGIEIALYLGLRGLPTSRVTLARLKAKKRGSVGKRSP